MKILLIEPAKAPVTMGGEEYFLYESLALEYIGAAVSKDHDVKILDMRIDKKLQKTLDDFLPDVVGITSYTVHVNTVKALFDGIKKWNSEVLTVVGGHHATVVPEDFLSPSIDLIVQGEGIFVFREIIERCERGEDFEGVPGVAYAKNGNLAKTDYSQVIDLDAFPFPDRKLTAPYRKHYYSEWMKPLASIRTSKGCPYRCNFCALWKISGGKYFKREPEKIVEELAGIEEEFVFFADDESLVDVERMRSLANKIKEAGIRKRYFLYGRSDTIAKNQELLEIWRKVGLERIFVGLEFFRDDDLRYIHKGSTAEDNGKAIKIIHDLGLEVYASFIVRPEFKKEDFDIFCRYGHELGLSFASFAVLTPLPGTDLYEKVKDKMLTHNYDYFDFIHTLLPTELPLKEFYKEYARLYRKGVPFRNAMAFLMKCPWMDIIPNFHKALRWQKRLKSLHLDYDD